MNNKPKLIKAAEEMLSADDEQRISFLYKPKWIHYKQAQDILEKMDQLLRLPQSHRMPNMLLISRTNNGKTNLALRFAEKNSPDINTGGDHILAPVLFIQAPPSPSESAMYSQILNSLYERVPAASTDAKRQRTIEVLGKIQLKVLIIDELHNFLSGSSLKQQTFLNALKFLCNELKISIIGCGTQELMSAVASDSQVQNRFKPYILPIWKVNKEYQQLLSSFEQTLPLKKVSNLHSPILTKKIHSLSEGSIGETAELLREAAEFAIRNKLEYINIEVLENCKFIPPSERSKEAKNI